MRFTKTKRMDHSKGGLNIELHWPSGCHSAYHGHTKNQEADASRRLMWFQNSPPQNPLGLSQSTHPFHCHRVSITLCPAIGIVSVLLTLLPRIAPSALYTECIVLRFLKGRYRLFTKLFASPTCGASGVFWMFLLAAEREHRFRLLWKKRSMADILL